MTSNRRWSVSADSRRALPKTLMVRGLTGGGGFKDGDRGWGWRKWLRIGLGVVRLRMGLGVQDTWSKGGVRCRG